MNEKRFMSLNEMKDELNNTPRYLRFWYWLNRLGGSVKRYPGRVRNLYERARYGVGYRDSWDLDQYLARVIGRGAMNIANENHVYPGEHNGWTEGKWKTFLVDLAAAMDMYQEDSLESHTDLELIKKTLHKMVDNFEYMAD